MMRDYASCVEEKYTAEQYASAWYEDLYCQLLDSVIEFFWSENYDDAEEYDHLVSVSDKAEDECLELCYAAYEAAYLRYQEERPEEKPVFEEWEVQDTTLDVFEILMEDLECRLDEVKKHGENRE